MMIKNSLYLFAVTALSLGLLSCSQSGPVENAANDLCECLKPVFSDMEKFSQALQSGDKAEMEKIATAAGKMGEQSANCMQSIQERYPEIEDDINLQTQVTVRIKELCPPPEIFGAIPH
ncbi:MAG TPA: hypothetical protein DDW45_06065 [Gammaproteobacteria bacterium]|nr:hypothetical protein [Gammaproteobacteria bacterium]